VFDDKFGVSDVHLDVIPTRVVEDMTHLTKDDIPMVKRTCPAGPTFPNDRSTVEAAYTRTRTPRSGLYEMGLNEIKQRNLARFQGKNVEDYIVAGFNMPVSVKVSPV
jgi:hypothetical protein